MNFETAVAEPEVVAPVTPPADLTPKQVKTYEKQLREARDEAKTARETAQYWSERAKATPAAAPAAPVAADEPDDDLLEAVTSGDKKRFATSLKKMGFVSEADVNSRINTVRESARVEGMLNTKFPALQSDKSPLFKEASKQYQILIADEPALKNSTKTTLMATRLAEQILLARGDDPTALTEEDEGDLPDAEDDDDDTAILKDRTAKTRGAETEKERVRRVGAQGGKGRPNVSRTSDADDPDLGRAQKELVDRFKEAGADISLEGLRKRTNGIGVTMSNRAAPRGGRMAR